MTPSPSLSSNAHQHSPSSDRPERSRNAKAQARHRAKRKAYIEQLEQTVVKLQTIMNLSPEQVAALPPPSVRIRELEQENQRLHHENDNLRRQVEGKHAQLQQQHFAFGKRNTFPTADREDDRDCKRRRMSGEGAYLSPNDSPPPLHDDLIRPAPVSLTLPLSHQGTHPSPNTSSHHPVLPSSTSIYPLHVPPSYQMPETPSGSRSPSLSKPHRVMQTTSSSLHPNANAHINDSNGLGSHAMHHHPSVSSQNHHAVPSYYTQSSGQFQLVKMEDEHYMQSSPQAHCNSYASFTAAQPDLGTWHGYPSERAVHHRMNA